MGAQRDAYVKVRCELCYGSGVSAPAFLGLSRKTKLDFPKLSQRAQDFEKSASELDVRERVAGGPKLFICLLSFTQSSSSSLYPIG